MLKLNHNIQQVVPLYHPTSILLVDDNEDFLHSMKLVLQPGFECFVFQHASDAIQFVRSRPVLLHQARLESSEETDAAMEHIRDPVERRLHIEVSRLPKVFADRSRFARASVLVADNAMPGMSGLDMLDALKDAPMRKLLLSGMVDEQEALNAINSGLIDAYYPKHHPALHDALAGHLRTLQFEFFRQLTRPFEPALANGDARFLSDQSFREAFDRFAIEYRIIEHCVLMQPPGILGLDESGNPVIMLVADDDYRQASFEIAQAEGAPHGLLRCLINSQTLAAFPTRTGFYSRSLEPHWNQYVWPSQGFGGDGWRYAIIDEPDVVRQVCSEVASYAEHRQRRLN